MFYYVTLLYLKCSIVLRVRIKDDDDDDQLNFSENAQYIFKKGIQRIHFLRLLKNMNVDKHIMSLFYRYIVESAMAYNIISRFGSSHKKDQHKLAKIGKIAKRMGVRVVSEILLSCPV